MFLGRLTAYIISFLLCTTILLQPTVVFADKNEAYYTTNKISGCKKGAFAILTTDANFRKGPSTNAGIWMSLTRNSLVKLDGDKFGEWQKVEYNNKAGYIFADFLKIAAAEDLVEEDISLGDLQLGQRFDKKVAQRLGKIRKESRDGSLQIYDFKQLQVKVKRSNKKIEEMITTSPIFYTMRGVGIGDLEGRVVGQYGMPSRVVYLNNDAKNIANNQRNDGKDIEENAVIVYGYSFPSKSKLGKQLEFYFGAEGDVVKIILSNED